jgi:Ca2+-transporting ATPase
MVFGSLVAAQLQHAIACRTPGENPFQRTDLHANPMLRNILLGSFALQGGAYFIPPLRRALGLASIGITGAVVTAITSILPSLITLWRTSNEPAISRTRLADKNAEPV